MNTGKVKWFNAEKGYGFIECDGYSDVFVHFTNIRMYGFKTLLAGFPVEFDLIQNERGVQAINVVQQKPLL